MLVLLMLLCLIQLPALVVVTATGTTSQDSDRLEKMILKLTNKLEGSCPPVNNIPDERACWLRVSQMTFPGTHNSGARDDLKLGFLNLPVPSCKHQNQQLTISEQLDIGVRSLDLDVAYRSAKKVKDSAVIMHCAGVCAYGEKLESVLTAVSQFLKDNTHEVLMIRIVNYKADDDAEKVLLTQAILQLAKDIIGIRKLNFQTDPLIASALVNKRTVFFYLNEELWDEIHRVKFSLRKMRKFIRPHAHLSTWWQLHRGIHLTCDLEPGSMRYFNRTGTQDVMRKYPWVPIISDWYEPGVEMGLCLTDAAQKCKETVADNIQIAEYLQQNFNRTVNILMTDFTGEATVEAARHMNLLNMKYFVEEKQGYLPLKVAFSNHMTQYPFVEEKTGNKRRIRLISSKNDKGMEET